FLVAGSYLPALLLREPEGYSIRLVDRLAVSGKNAAVDLYEVIDADAPVRQQAKLATRPVLQSAMQRYFRGEFDAALTLFEQMRAQDPDDFVHILFAERCSRYLQEGP